MTSQPTHQPASRSTRRSTSHSTVTRRAVTATGLLVALAAATACGATSASSGVISQTSDNTAATEPSTTTSPSSVSSPAPQTTTSSPATSPASSPTSAPTTATPATTEPPAPRPSTVVDELVDVDGIHIHIRCEGTGDSTVVLIAGFESGSEGWSAVAPVLAERSRVCAYDRPGTGTSDPAGPTQTFTTEAADLHALLTAAGEPGPYVVVGHSFGGPEAVTFTTRNRDDVEALVLVDASPTDWPTTLCSVDDGTDAAAFINGMCAGWEDPTANVEHLDVFPAFDQAASTQRLGALPMTVLTAVDRELPPTITDGERARVTAAWDAGQRRWAQLSSDSHVVSVAHTGHYIQLEHPDVVIDAITALLP